MKRVKAAVILQTLVFSQKKENELTPEQALVANRDEVVHYRAMLKRAKTRYQITDESEQADGSIIVHVCKQYNYKADVDEYFR